VSDIGSSVGGGGRGPDDRLREALYLEQMQRAREGSQGEETLQNPSSKLFHYAAAVFCLKKFLGEFTENSKMRASSMNKEKTLEDLVAFKNVLEELGHFDKSHDPEFTHRLSLVWQNLYENCIGVDEKAAQTDIVVSQILSFVGEIAHFPPGEDYTLGFYLAEHAGQDWIPFPFMNLLAELHEGFQTAPDTGQLALWIQKLEEIIGSQRNPFI